MLFFLFCTNNIYFYFKNPGIITCTEFNKRNIICVSFLAIITIVSFHDYFFFLNKFIYLFIIYFWLRFWVFVAVCGLSLVAASGGYSSLRCVGFSLWWLLLLRSTGSRRAGFSSCGLRALERRLGSCGARV